MGRCPKKLQGGSRKIRRAKSYFFFFNPASSIFSKTTSPSIATISPLAKPVSPSNAAPLLEGGVPPLRLRRRPPRQLLHPPTNPRRPQPLFPRPGFHVTTILLPHSSSFNHFSAALRILLTAFR